MKRRQFLSLLPATGLAPFALPLTNAEGSLRQLYYRWQAVKDDFNALPFDCDGAVVDSIFCEMRDLEQQAADFDPLTVEDFAFKIVFADDDGDMNWNVHQAALAKGAYAMVGIEPRIWLKK